MVYLGGENCVANRWREEIRMENTSIVQLEIITLNNDNKRRWCLWFGSSDIKMFSLWDTKKVSPFIGDNADVI